ncbi:uncharacterized protein LY89DRAFT_754448 [Mollisia scopiformis]|uniref:Uncharacterized protein n=1 Tax=Mollisia scopiformis TaxID=149040 RepID=A0A194X058_MOLSC|nr:uncharacterized protein LY89DRAFT_754448 [Mollisia scopiformis]KUJ13580.1 hypothetical protein LY89DRAFT_754448 [Mollisia scopiformis]
MHILVEKKLNEESENSKKFERWQLWAPRYLNKAAERGWEALAQILIRHKVDVESLHRNGTGDSQTALCTAAENGHAQVADVLLKAGAKLDFRTEKTKDSPLTFAIWAGKREVVKLLLDVGANFTEPNAMAKTPKKLAEEGGHREILQMLAEKEKDGLLAETTEKLDHSVDQAFEAEVVTFTRSSDAYQHNVESMSVYDLLDKVNPLGVGEHRDSDVSLRWFHLPANNMRWVEVLVSKLYDNSAQAYRFLSGERWVGRQHHSLSDIPHARFMQPLCQTFQALSNPTSGTATIPVLNDHSRECLVLFMPFLHWDTVDNQSNTSINQHQGSNDISVDTKAQSLLRAYLRDPHPLHIRRTLDQYYYYAMESTEERDSDQVVTRYQKKYHLEPKVITMVDQLWLWVLAGEGDRADTVITCFPQRDRSSGDLDRYDFTDVLINIKLHLLNEKSSFMTGFELAGIIASQCSRAYLDIARLDKTPGFSEIYETAISDVVSSDITTIHCINAYEKNKDARRVEAF